MTARPWLDEYPAGVAAEIDASVYPSLKDLIERSCARFGDAPAFSNLGTQLSFADVERLSARFGNFLRSLPGMGKGERVAVMLPNLLQSPIVVFGILRAGLVVVNVNPLYTVRELEHQLTDSGVRAIVVLDSLSENLRKVLPRTAVETVVVTKVGDQHGFLKRLLVDFVARRRRPAGPPIEGAVHYRDVMRAGNGPAARTEEPLGPRDVAFLQYTGGTTGIAKGAVLTHGNMVSNVLQLTAWAGPFFDRRHGVVVTALPLYHIFALTTNLLGFTELGGHNVLITDPRDMRGFVREMRREPLAFLSGVNTMFNALLHAEGFADLDFGSFQMCLAGGMAVQRDVAERWLAVTGVAISQGYGLTEASPVVSASPLDGAQFNGSVGLPLPSTDVAILDDEHRELPIGEAGEICVRGPQVMQGYWKRPEETAAVLLPGGWLRTGDVGRLDEKGYLFIEDRKKDMIVVSGFKVFPNEVEDVIMRLAGVHEVAVVGVEDPRSGEAVKAFIVRKDPALEAADVLAHCRENLTGYKRPKLVEFVETLPKSNVGKVLRRELKEVTAK